MRGLCFLAAIILGIAAGAEGSALGKPAATARVDDRRPAWSPTGRWIAFVRVVTTEGSPRSSLYVVRPSGSGLRLVRKGAQDPRWSPNGRTLAFTFGGYAALARADGTRVRRLVRGAAAAWAPDGRRLAVIRPDGSIGVLDVPRRKLVRRLRAVSDDPRTVSWSPDGQRLALGLNNRVGVLSLAGGKETILGVGYDPTWSADGTVIAAACKYSARVFFFDPAVPTPHACSDGGIHWQAWAPAWSPDGRTLALYVSHSPFPHYAVRLQERGAATSRFLTAGVDPSWAPDGSTIVFAAATVGRSRAFRLHVIRADGTGLRRLPLTR